MLTLINGQDAKITSDRGYPAIKLIGTRAWNNALIGLTIYYIVSLLFGINIVLTIP
jgi:hypothetical protein